MTKAFVALAVPLALGSVARAALACPTPPPVTTVTTYPPVGTLTAPLNTVVLATYDGDSPALANPGLVLEDGSGAMVDATLTELPMAGPLRHIFLLVPTQPLLPSTKYYIADQVNWTCTVEPCNAQLTPQYSIVTGTAPDVTPTPAPVLVAVTPGSADVCAAGDESCCGPYHALLTHLQNPAVGAVRYDLYDSGQLVESNIPFVLSTDCAEPGDVPYPSPNPSVPLAPGVHHLTLNAFDGSNNETIGTTTLDIDLECAALAVDAGLPSAPDAPPADAHPAAASGSSGGCAVATTGRGAGWLLVALAPVVWRRRSRRTSPRQPD